MKDIEAVICVSRQTDNFFLAGVRGVTNDVYKPWVADAMHWPIRGFEATGWVYWHSPEEAVLHRNSIVFQLIVSRTKLHVFKYFSCCIGDINICMFSSDNILKVCINLSVIE